MVLWVLLPFLSSLLLTTLSLVWHTSHFITFPLNKSSYPEFLRPSLIFQLSVGICAEMFHQHLKLNGPETELKPKWTVPSLSVLSECHLKTLKSSAWSHGLASRTTQFLKNLPIPHLFFSDPVLIWELTLSYWTNEISSSPSSWPSSLSCPTASYILWSG